MNIAYVTNVVYPFVTGGAEKRVHELGTRLAARDHEVTVYGRHYWDGPAEMPHEGLTLRAVAEERPLYVDQRRSIAEAVGFAAALWRPLRQHADEHDLVVASVFPYFPVVSAAAVASEFDLPLVTTWHECWQSYWWEYLGVAGAAGIAVERVVASLPQYPIAVSTLTADRLASIGPSRDRITVVGNGIDVDRIQSIDPVADGFDVLFVGRLVDAKNVDTLLRAIASLDRSVSVGIIGDGPERVRLERLTDRLDIADSISFLGFVDDYDTVLAHMRGAAVFVSPSTREGFGLTALEAMAAGCTVVVADAEQSAAPEVVGDAGLVVGPDVSSISRGLERALGGWLPPTEPGTRAATFDWDLITDRAERGYERAVRGDW